MEQVEFSDVRNSHKNKISEHKKIQRFSVQKIPKTRIFMHPENQKGEIDFPSWEKLDLRVGKIIKVVDLEGADKLYKLEVDLGDKIGKRVLVAGLKKNYSKEELKGKKSCFLG